MFAFLTGNKEGPEKQDIEKYLPLDQLTLFEQIRKISFNPKTYEYYTNLTKKYPIVTYPASYLLILREQTRTLNDKNGTEFIEVVTEYHDVMITTILPQQTTPNPFKKSLQLFFVDVVQKVEKFVQKNTAMIQLLVPMVDHFLSSVPEGILSPYHALLVHIQFALRDYQAGREIYKRKYHGVSEGMNSTTMQLYLYYAGCLALFNRDMNESFFLFDQCITMPTKEVTPQLVAPYKKVKLLSLIVNHQGYTIKKNPHLASFVENYPSIDVYHKITEAFVSNPDRISYYINIDGEQLKKDGNFGLAQQVQISYIYCGIRKVSKAFNSIAIKELAKRIKLDAKEFERNLKKLVDGGFVNGRIDGEIFYFGENVIPTKGMEELFAQLQEAEGIYMDMRNHLTQREEERDLMLVALAEEKEKMKAANKK